MTHIGSLFRRVAAAALSIASASASAQSITNYSDIWWNPNESGWGVTIADHETNMFAILYAYRADSRPIWYSIPGGTLSSDRRFFSGDVYRTHGPPYTNAVFDPSAVVVTKVGTAAFDFAPAGQQPGLVLLTYSIDGVTASKLIQRLAYGSAPSAWGTDRTDLWWNSSESGWGLALAQHGNNIFGIWYTYDTDGEPLWFTIPGGTFAGPQSFSGSLYRTTGPSMGLPTYDPSRVVVSNVGTGTITFTGTKSQDACPGFGANFVATVGPVTNPRLICRLPFGNAGPGTPPSPPLTVTTTCSGSYSAQTTFPTICSNSSGSRTFSGTFTISSVSWFQTGQQDGTIAFQSFFAQTVPETCTSGPGFNSCTCHDESMQGSLPIVVNINSTSGNVSGTADIDLGIGNFSMAFQVFGSSTVTGTMNYQYSGTTIDGPYNGQGTFNCIAQ